MCGIAGIFGLEDKSVIRKIIKLLNHRGPDGNGFFIDDSISLGVCRLAIVDCKSGNQPIFNEDGNLCIIFNGEIYNYLELRKRLYKKHKFNTNTDTEVILHLYEDYGNECVKYLEGMFAFAIYDNKEKTLFLARDKMGIKPLFYTKLDDIFLFASEIKGLSSFDDLKIKIDRESLKQKYVFDFLLGDKTYFKDIKQLMPGHTLTISKKYNSTNCYFKIKSTRKMNDEKEIKIKLLLYLNESIKKMTASDVKVGSLLSGGIDSTILTTIYTHNSDMPVRTFTISDSLFNEDFVKSKLISEYLGTNHFEILFDKEIFFKNIPKYIYYTEDYAYEFFFAYELFNNINKYKKDIKSVICGHGADELFGGYERYKSIIDLKNKILWNSKKIKDNRLYNKYKFIINGWNLDSYLKFEIENQLPNLQLSFIDRCSMAFGIEVRVPYLYSKIVDVSNSINSGFKIKNGIEKYILRETAKKINIPKEIIQRPKRPGGYLTSPTIIQYFDYFACKYLDDNYVNNHKYGKFFKRKSDLLCFDILYKIFVEGLNYKKVDFDVLSK